MGSEIRCRFASNFVASSMRMTWQTRVAVVGVVFWSLVAAAALPLVVAVHGIRPRVMAGAITVLAACLAARSARIGITATGSTLVVRGWLRTHTVPLPDIAAVEVVPYTGLLGGRDGDRFFRMLLVKRRCGRDIYVESLMGAPATVRAIAVEVERWAVRRT